MFEVIYPVGPLVAMCWLFTSALDSMLVNFSNPGNRSQVEAVAAQISTGAQCLGPILFGKVFQWGLKQQELQTYPHFLTRNAVWVFEVSLAAACCITLASMSPSEFIEDVERPHEIDASPGRRWEEHQEEEEPTPQAPSQLVSDRPDSDGRSKAAPQ